MGDEAATTRFDDTYDNARRLFLLIHTSYEDLANLHTQLHTALHRTSGPFGRHTSAIAPKFVERVGLARTGGKQAVLMRADHRFFGRIEFECHSGPTSFR